MWNGVIEATPEVASAPDFRVVPNIRVPEPSFIQKLYSDASAEQASGRENLESWEFSDGDSLPASEV
jgi:hypothetical protein